MTSSKIEADVVKSFDKVLKELGGERWKFVSPGRSGVPDNICILRGVLFFVEFKRPNGEPRKLQEKVITRMRNLGAPVLVIDTTDMSSIRELLNERFHT